MADLGPLVEDAPWYGGENPGEQGHQSGGNLPEPTTPITIFTRFGPFRNPSDVTGKEWGFIVFAVLGAALMIGLSSHRIHTLKGREEPYSSEIVMLLSEIGCLYYICHGVLFERYQEMFVSVIAILAGMIYCIYDFAAKGDFTYYPKVRLGLDVAIGIVLVLAAVVGWYFYCRYPRLVCRQITTEPLQTNYQRLLWFNSFLVFDLQFAVSSVIFYWVDSQVDPEEVVVLGVGIGLNLMFCVAGKLAIRFEHHWGTVFFMNLGSFHFSFFLFKTVKQWDGIKSGVYLDLASLLFSIVSAVIRVIVLVLSGKITEKYGQGLKEKLFGDRQPQQPAHESANVQQRETHDRSSAEDYISM